MVEPWWTKPPTNKMRRIGDEMGDRWIQPPRTAEDRERVYRRFNGLLIVLLLGYFAFWIVAVALRAAGSSLGVPAILMPSLVDLIILLVLFAIFRIFLGERTISRER